MDHIDEEILQILQHNARASLKNDRGEDIPFLPRRFQQELKTGKDGIITSYQAQIDPMEAPDHILAFINPQRASGGRQKFYHYAEGIPNIQSAAALPENTP